MPHGAFWPVASKTGWQAPATHAAPWQLCPQVPQLEGSIDGLPHAASPPVSGVELSARVELSLEVSPVGASLVDTSLLGTSLSWESLALSACALPSSEPPPPLRPLSDWHAAS